MAKAKMTFRLPKALRELVNEPERFTADGAHVGVEAALAFWHAKILPGHFDEQAPGKYPGAYRPRGAKYERRKRNRRPMFDEGDFYRTVTSSYSIMTSVRKGKVSGVLRLPRARVINLWSGGKRKHDFQKSLTVFNGQDIAAMRRVIHEHAQQRVNERMNSGGQDVQTFTG